MAAITNELIAIESVVLLFWDYTDEDIRALRLNDNFNSVWVRHIDNKGGQEAYQVLWECWMTKFNPVTKQVIIDYAVSRFGEEKREGLEFERKFRQMTRTQQKPDSE